MLKHLKFYACDCCHKQLRTDKIQMYANRVVGIDGNLMIHLSIDAGEKEYHRQQTVCLCPKCWARVFRAVRRVLKMGKDGEK